MKTITRAYHTGEVKGFAFHFPSNLSSEKKFTIIF